jgi:hypothetical protein
MKPNLRRTAAPLITRIQKLFSESPELWAMHSLPRQGMFLTVILGCPAGGIVLIY